MTQAAISGVGPILQPKSVFGGGGGGGAAHDYFVVHGTVDLSADMDPTDVTCDTIVADTAGVSDGTGVTLQDGDVWWIAATVRVPGAIDTTGAWVTLDISPDSGPASRGQTLHLDGPNELEHSSPAQLNASRMVIASGATEVRARVATDAGTLSDADSTVILEGFRLAVGSGVPLTFPGDNVYSDTNGNKVSAALSLTAGQAITVNISALAGASGYDSGGFVGIYSPSNASYGSDSYFGAGDVTSGSWTFHADVTAADWYVWVAHNGPGDYDPDATGSGNYVVG